ncbi:hypothetical protein UA08_02077 [Talaromyces atroroseus]|uniref:White collar 1 protein n=1 Tax=Talaromyces atroroseus TaxID=1441469 RepID=A0A1Q5QC14_TALAT|nr:hypothetical protein UA08_02077 [Talaromyces atroroseus]OKL63460.1 hypothetical protein UA08_02077 [Talaromyces atroroseus]
MPLNPSAIPPQSGEVNSLLDPNLRGQPTSMGYVGNTMGTYQFNASPPYGSNPASSNVVYTTNDTVSMQQFPHNRSLYHSADRFNLDPNYDPASFAPSENPMAAFQHHYPGAVNFQESDMAFALAYEDPATAQSQSLDMLFSNSTYAPLPQSSMQPTSAAGQLRSSSLGGPQQDWADMSNFNISLSGPNPHGVSPAGVHPTEDSLVALPQSTGSARSQSISSYLPPHTSPMTSTPPTSRNPFIPREIAASTIPRPGAGKVASQYLNAYSSSGFDMFGILAKIANRPNPEIDIGAVDMSCAFILCDVTSHDDPIVYVSDAFERLTGYTKHEILGRNCRFLQSPDGKVDPGTKRKYVDDQTVYRLKEKIQCRTEVQVSMLNYRKGGQSFVNLLTMIPIQWDTSDYKFYVGFQVDLVERPNAVTKRNTDGSYTINYQRDQLSRYVLHAPETRKAQPRLSNNISHDEATSALRTIGAGARNNRFLDRVLLENADDSSSRLLEYDPSELVGRSISSVCHPSDIAPVTRELKQSTAGSPVSVVYRFRRKNSGYIWIESYGSLHIEPGKGRKCLILVGRQRPVYALDRSGIVESGGIGENDLWTKMSLSGMFLFVSSNARALLDRTPAEMVGKGIQDFMRTDSRGELGKALELARTGRQATFKHEVRHKRGHVLQAQTTLFPGDANPGSKPSFLIARIYLLKNSRSTYIQKRNSPAVVSSSASTTDIPSSVAVASTASLISLPEQNQITAPTEAGSHGLPLGTQDEALLSVNNIFEELKTVRSSSWQFELRQLERNNRLLAEELQSLLSRRKKRKRKKGTGPLEKSCATCGTRNTPEWRRGPSGHRDLCNSCGLRWAKQNGRISPKKLTDQNDKNSSSGSAKASPGSATDERPQDK